MIGICPATQKAAVYLVVIWAAAVVRHNSDSMDLWAHPETSDRTSGYAFFD